MSQIHDTFTNTSRNYIPCVSRYGLYCMLSFSIWTILFRFVLPFGEEPDFTVRAVELVKEQYHVPWIPYYWLSDLLSNLDVESFCKIEASPTSILGSIDAVTCSQPLEQILLRVLLTLFCCVPLLWILVYRNALYKLLRMVGFKLESKALNERLDCLGASMLIPGMIYHLGLLSYEQLSLIISLLISVFWGSWLLVIGLTSFATAIDLGNGLVIIVFLLIYFLILPIYRFSGYQGVTLFLIGTVTFFYVGSYELLSYVNMISILSEKSEAIYVKSMTADFLEKYPIVLRPFVTYITAVFMTPSGIKALPVQLMFVVATFVGIKRIFKRYRLNTYLRFNSLKKTDLELSDFGATEFLPLFAALTTILAFSMMLPDYANAKYYMFLAPFVLLPFMVVFKRYFILLFMNASCTLVTLFVVFQYV